MVTSIDNGKIWLHSASADVSDIDQMQRVGPVYAALAQQARDSAPAEKDGSTLPQAEDPPGRESKASDRVPAWRRILGLSLQVFGAGAQGYANAYRGPNTPQGQSQPPYSAPKTCYTNFIGATAFTNCY